MVQDSLKQWIPELFRMNFYFILSINSEHLEVKTGAIRHETTFYRFLAFIRLVGIQKGNQNGW